MGKGGTLESFAPPPGVPRSKHMGNDVPVLLPTNPNMPWWTMGDVDSYFMLFFDNLSSLVTIIAALTSAPMIFRGMMPADEWNSMNTEYLNMIYRKMLPGAGVALLFGNCYYTWMARKLAYYDKRENVTAHPYGVNTPGGFLMTYNVVYTLFIKYYCTEWNRAVTDGKDPGTVKEATDKIWQGAVASNLVVGLISCAGAWAGPWIIRNVPLPGLLTPTMGVGFVYLGLDPFYTIIAEPMVAWVPMYLSMAGYFATKNGSFEIKGIKIPCAFLVILAGCTAYWSNLCHYNQKVEYKNNEDAIPQYVYDNRGCGSVTNHIHGDGGVNDAKKRLWENQMTFGLGLSYWKDVPDFIGLVTPVAIQSVVETLEHWQMGCLKGDSYNMREMMFVDGFGTVLGSFCGSFLPNTVYLGHPIHKANGASCGYGLANAFTFFFLLNSGIFAMVGAVIPIETMAPILMAVGLSIVRNALEVTTSRNHPAMIPGIWCVIADWVLNNGAGNGNAGAKSVPFRGWYNAGQAGGIMNALIITSTLSDMIDRKYVRGACFCFAAVWFSLFGVMHSNNLQGHSVGADQRAGRGEVTWAGESPAPTPPGNEGWRFAIAYGMVGAGFIAAHFLQQAGFTDPPHEEQAHAQALSKALTAGGYESSHHSDDPTGSGKPKTFDENLADLEADVEEERKRRASTTGPGQH